MQNKSINFSFIVQFNSICMLVSHAAPNLIAGFAGHFQYNLNSPDSSWNLKFCLTYVLHLGILCANDFPHMPNWWLKILNSLVYRVPCWSQIQSRCLGCLCTLSFILHHMRDEAGWDIVFQLLFQAALTWNSLADQLLCKY